MKNWYKKISMRHIFIYIGFHFIYFYFQSIENFIISPTTHYCDEFEFFYSFSTFQTKLMYTIFTFCSDLKQHPLFILAAGERIIWFIFRVSSSTYQQVLHHLVFITLQIILKLGSFQRSPPADDDRYFISLHWELEGPSRWAAYKWQKRWRSGKVQDPGVEHAPWRGRAARRRELGGASWGLEHRVLWRGCDRSCVAKKLPPEWGIDRESAGPE